MTFDNMNIAHCTYCLPCTHLVHLSILATPNPTSSEIQAKRLTALFIFMRNRCDNFLPPHLGPQVSPLNSCILLLFAQICQGSHLKILIPASKQLSSLHSQSITPLTQENQNQRQQKRLQK